jgi:TetR/AcrR family transcriptional repressor of nem operon
LQFRCRIKSNHSGRTEPKEVLLRKSRTETAQTRASIVDAAADQVRRVGIAQASLADVMSAAGLTHGGFYRHFEDKEQLLAEALHRAADASFAAFLADLARGGVDAAVAGYLSAEHRSAAIPTCPFAACGSELRNAGDAAQAASATALETLLKALAPSGPESPERGAVIAMLATLVGAMTLARAVPPGPLSDEILRSARDALRT